jgi:hypothetical protein
MGDLEFLSSKTKSGEIWGSLIRKSDSLRLAELWGYLLMNMLSMWRERTYTYGRTLSVSKWRTLQGWVPMDTNMSRFGLQKTCVLKSVQLSSKLPAIVHVLRMRHLQTLVSFLLATNGKKIHLQRFTCKQFNFSLILLCFVFGANGKSIERRGTQTTDLGDPLYFL